MTSSDGLNHTRQENVDTLGKPVGSLTADDNQRYAVSEGTAKKTEYTFAEWKEEGKRLFGTENRRLWKFKCPACGFVQSFEDFIRAGATEDEACSMIGFSCVGRIMEEKGQFMQNKKQPCNYAGGGLFRLNPLTIITPEGEKHQFFDFAETGGNNFS